MQDQRRGNGRGGRRRHAPEEAPEDETEVDAVLDADTFAGKRASSRLDHIFSEQLPWERDEAGAAPSSEALIQRLKVPEAPKPKGPAPRAVLGNPLARRVDAGFDASEAVLRTWQAQAELRQHAPGAQAPSPTDQPAAPDETELSRILRQETPPAPGRPSRTAPPLPPPPAGRATGQ
ncbi:MAG: hypothetical protein VKS61_15960, partial [Candidatus Sericytochromatia bacterium]|nr:hypothetical protein [Candidatus Sericytochromatia bacterium]